MLLDWFQDPQKQLGQCFERFWSWLHPDLRRVEDEDDRVLAIAFAEINLSKSQRRLILFLPFIGFPIGGGIGLLIAAYLRLPLATYWGAGFFVGGGMAGWAFLIALYALLMRRKVREAMRELGYKVCPGCGYDLRGVSVGCPECGWRREPAS